MIGVVCRSRHISARDLSRMVDACGRQLWWQAAPAWGAQPQTIVAYDDVRAVPARDPIIVIADAPDGSGVLGFHSETLAGRAWGRVFVEPILDDHGSVLLGSRSVSAVLSHECIETLIDPNVNLWAEAPDGSMWALEACDPVEGASYALHIDDADVHVSDFVFPEFFDLRPPRRTRFDKMGIIKAPFSLPTGVPGYAVVRKREETLTLGVPTLPGKNHPAARTTRRRARR